MPSATSEEQQSEINNVISDSESSSSQHMCEEKRTPQKIQSWEVRSTGSPGKLRSEGSENTVVNLEGIEELSDYEKLRLRNIQRNQERLAKLGLLTPDFRNEKKEASIRKKPVRKRKKNVETFTSAPLRRSTRRKKESVESEKISNATDDIRHSCQLQEKKNEVSEAFE